MQSEFVISVSCGAHCTAAIAEPRGDDRSKPKRRMWIWGQNQVYLILRLRINTLYLTVLINVHFCISMSGAEADAVMYNSI